MLAALTLLLTLQPEPAPTRADSLFLPYFEHAKKPGSEWLADFEKSGGRNLDALWCAFWSGDRSEPVLESYRRQLARNTDPMARRAIDTILDHWGVEHDCPAAKESRPARASAVTPGTLQLPSGAYDWSVPLRDGDDDALVRELASDDPELRLSAAVTLVARQQAIDAVVRMLARRLFDDTKGTWRGTWRPSEMVSLSDSTIPLAERDAYALTFCRDRAGTAFDDAVAALLSDDSVEDDFRLFLLRQVGFSEKPAPERLASALVPLVGRLDKVGRHAFTRLIDACLARRGYGFVGDEHWWLHRPYVGEPIADVPGGVLADGIEAWLTPRIAGDALSAEDLRQVMLGGLRSSAARERAVPLLLPLIDRPGELDDLGEQALFVLTHLGASGDAVKRRYVALLDSIASFDETTFERLSCLQQHDAQTLAALERVFGLAGDRDWQLAPVLASAGLLAASDSKMTARVLERAAGYDTFLLGFRGDCPRLPGEAPLATLAKLAIEIRTGKELGQDISAKADEFVSMLTGCEEPQGNYGPGDPVSCGCMFAEELHISTPRLETWALEHLLDRDAFHGDEVAGMVETMTLDRRAQAILCRIEPLFEDSISYTNLFAAQGEAAIERVPKLRAQLSELTRDWNCALPKVNLDVLEAILRITRPNARETGLLALAIELGGVGERVRAIEIAGARKVQAPEVRDAVAARRSDCDVHVRAAAEKAAALLGIE